MMDDARCEKSEVRKKNGEKDQEACLCQNFGRRAGSNERTLGPKPQKLKLTMKLTKPTYRLLSKQELENLEKDFIYFLSSQGIDVAAWDKMKAEDDVAVVHYIVLFSNFIFENVLDRAEYLIRINPTVVEVFHCQASQVVKLDVTSERADLDLTTLNLLDQTSYVNDNKLHISMSEKRHEPTQRKSTLFLLMENRCLIDDGKLYKALCMMVADDH